MYLKNAQKNQILNFKKIKILNGDNNFCWVNMAPFVMYMIYVHQKGNVFEGKGVAKRKEGEVKRFK